MEIKSTSNIQPIKLNALVYGESGSGKTYLASTLNNCIIVSVESGLLTLKDFSVDYVEATTLEQLRSTLAELSTSKYDTIFIDSITEISQKMVEYAKAVYPNDNQIMKVYGLHNDMITKMIKYTRDMNKNIIYTALQKVDKDVTGIRYHVPNMAGSIASSCPALFDFVFNLSVIEKDNNDERLLLTSSKNNYICKSRVRLDDYELPHLGNIINKAFKKGDENV